MTINIDLIKLEEIMIVAGNAIMAVRDRDFDKTIENDGSPVTEADLAADRNV